MPQPDATADERGQKRQLARFCLYGFLKNLQFFEPFLILAFRQKGFSFASIGILISFRALSVNLMEIPSGVIADVWGRRRSMIVSLAAYATSFVVFALADAYWVFFPAMYLFAVGEAFRTGTHKAMVFDWLVHNDRRSEKTRIYGLTRSWSKQGSSLNCIIAAGILIAAAGNYQWVFALAVIPYLLGIANFMFYPAYLDGPTGRATTAREGFRVLGKAVKLLWTRRRLSTLIVENVCFEGVFSIVKDYLQPTVKAVALSLPVLLALSGETRTAILVAAVYLVLNQASSIASRSSHRAVSFAGSESRLGLWLWLAAGCLYTVMLAGFLAGIMAVPILCFVVLFVLLNLWKPALVSRFHDLAELDSAATTLSITNQSKTLSIAILAPLLGFAIDRSIGPDGSALTIRAFSPVAMLGMAAALAGLCLNRSADRKQSAETSRRDNP